MPSQCALTEQPILPLQTILAPGTAPESTAAQLQALGQPYPAEQGAPSFEDLLAQLAAAPRPPAGAAQGTSPELRTSEQLPGSGSDATTAAAPAAKALGSARTTRKFARAFGCARGSPDICLRKYLCRLQFPLMPAC